MKNPETVEAQPVVQTVPKNEQKALETHTIEQNILEDYLAAQETTDQVSEARAVEIPVRDEPQASGSDASNHPLPVLSAPDEQQTIVHVTQLDAKSST